MYACYVSHQWTKIKIKKLFIYIYKRIEHNYFYEHHLFKPLSTKVKLIFIIILNRYWIGKTIFYLVVGRLKLKSVCTHFLPVRFMMIHLISSARVFWTLTTARVAVFWSSSSFLLGSTAIHTINDWAYYCSLKCYKYLMKTRDILSCTFYHCLAINCFIHVCVAMFLPRQYDSTMSTHYAFRLL